MRATGIIRRIDDLGRVVIPKEIRKVLKIREGDPLEIFTANDSQIVLRKYSPIGELNELAQEYAESLGEILNNGVVITDLESIIAVSKLPKKDYKNKEISFNLEKLIKDREVIRAEDDKIIDLIKDDNMEYKEQIIIPIISLAGDCVGAIAMVSNDQNTLSSEDEKILKVSARFLGKQVQ